MKKLFTTLLFSIACSATLWSQSFTLGITGGYCLPIASGFNTVSSTQYQNTGFPLYYTTNQNVVSASYGQGGNIALDFDWFSKMNIGCGLSLNALIGSPFSYSTQVNYLSGDVANFNFTDHPFSFQFIPHISFRHDFKIVSPILEMGMLIGITKVTEDYQASDMAGTQIQSSVNNHGGVMLGFHSSLGLAFKVSRIVRIMLAIKCTAGSYSPTEWARTSYYVNGVNQLSNLSVSDQQGIYVKQVNQIATQPSNQPQQDLKYSVPFSNVGINAGISFVLARSKQKKEQYQERVKRRNQEYKENNDF